MDRAASTMFSSMPRLQRHRRPRGRPPHDDVLTPAEWRVVDAIRHGLTNAAIARRLAISIDGVKFHVRNAVAKLGLRRRQDLRVWRGGAKDSASSSRTTSEASTVATATPPQLGAIGQVSRSVADIEAACAWYSDILGLKPLYRFGKLAFFDCGDTRLMLSAESGVAPESILYLRVDRIDTAHTALAERGVEFFGAPHLIHRHADGTEEWMAFFKDPEGRPLALMAQMRPTKP